MDQDTNHTAAAEPRKKRIVAGVKRVALRAMQTRAIFKPLTKCESLRFPQQYRGMEEFGEETIPRPFNKSSLTVWHKAADEVDKPVYVVFHGRFGHWGDRGIAKHEDQTYDRHYRREWLKALAATGAEIIAVHLSGQGASRGSQPGAGENYLRHDAQAVADYLQRKGIASDRVVVAGESLGGAAAVILAQEMTKRRKPPAALGLIASFSNMAEVVADTKNMPLPWVNRVLKHPLRTDDRLQALDPASTVLYLAHHRGDTSVSYKHKEQNEKAALHIGMTVIPRELENGYMRPGLTYAHTSWDPVKITADLEAAFRRSKAMRKGGYER